MVASIDERDSDSDDGIAAEYAVVERILDALLRGGDVFLRNDAADDLVFPFEALTIFERFDLKDDVSVLAFTSGLSYELALGSRGLAYSLAVSNLRTSDLDFDVELSAETVDDDSR